MSSRAVFDSHLNGQHRLNYLARGPEWAFAIPAGDFDALEEVMGLCSGFWNGAGSLIVTVTKAGRLDPYISHFLEIRPSTAVGCTLPWAPAPRPRRIGDALRLLASPLRRK
jgi:hypothetical protein